MARNEHTSARVAKIAAIGIWFPGRLSKIEIRSLAASVLAQCRDRKKPKRKVKAKRKTKKAKRP